MFVENLVKSGYVTLGENGRTILTNNGKKYLDAQTKSSGAKVELAKLKNLEYRKSLEEKPNLVVKKERKNDRYYSHNTAYVRFCNFINL